MHTILCDLPAVGLFEVGNKLIADFKKELVCFDIENNYEVVFKRDFSPGMGKVIGYNRTE